MNCQLLVSLILLSVCSLVHSQPRGGSSVRFFQEPSDVIAFPGNKVLLECIIVDSQSDLVDAQWYRNDVLIEGLQRHQNFRDVGTNLTIGLEIFDIMKADSGTIYHCTPNGQPQISSRRASIVVAGAPEFHQNESIISVVNTTISSISIQWQPAMTFSIVPVTKYIINLYNDSGLLSTFEFLTNVTMLSFTFSELESSSTYHISIVAVNFIGASEPTANFTVNTQSFTATQPLPPTHVDVCVSFDTSGYPTLQIQWQEPSNDDNKYFVYYGKRSGTTVERMLVGSITASIQMNHSSLNETFVVQLTTVRESVESSLTIPITQYINPLYEVQSTSISSSSAALECSLACMTENLQCIITSLQPATEMNVNKTSQQFLALEGLQESTTYQYCLSAYNNATNELIGFPICGVFNTTVNLQSQPSSLDDDMPLSSTAVVGIIIGIIAIMILTTIIMIILLVFCCLKKSKQSQERKVTSSLYGITTMNSNCDPLPQANKDKNSLHYVDLDINSTSGASKIKDVSVSYAEVVIPRSRKEQANNNIQKVDKNDQQKKAASLKFGYAELDLNSSSAQSEMQSSMNVQDDTAVTNSRTNVI